MRGLRLTKRIYVGAALAALLVAPVGCRSLTDSPQASPAPSGRALAVLKPRNEGTIVPAVYKPLPEAALLLASAEVQDVKNGTVVPPSACELPMNLTTALTLANGDNPTIALAAEAIRASEAAQLQARALLLPTLSAGVDFDWHNGNLQSSQGVIRNLERESVYFGTGTGAVGAGTVTVPGVHVIAHLADALYEPQIARERLTERQFEAAAVRNTVLLDVATTYLALVGAEERLRVVRQSEEEIREVQRLTANFANAGVSRQGDAYRAASEAQLARAEEARAEEDIAVAAAQLARLLHLDPSARLHGTGEPLPLLQLVDPREGLERLLQIAVANRPELAAREAELAARRTALRQEQVRPFVPLLSAGFSAGDFGGQGTQTTSRINQTSGRTDFDAYAVWSLQNFGFGNRALQRERQAVLNESVAERERVLDLIRREVAEAHELAAANLRELDEAKQELKTAQEGYRLDLDRAKNNFGRPIELLNSANLLAASRLEYVRALTAYNQAQFRLFVSLGQPPSAERASVHREAKPTFSR